MRIAPAITLSAEQRTVLESQARSRSLPVRVVERARILLMAAAGQQNKDIAAMLSVTPKKVARWRERFLALGVAGLQKEAPPPGREPTISGRPTRPGADMNPQPPRPDATHPSTRTLSGSLGRRPHTLC